MCTMYAFSVHVIMRQWIFRSIYLFMYILPVCTLAFFYILYPYKWWYYFLFCDRSKKLDWSDKVFTVRLLPIPNSLALRVGEICSIKDSLCAQWNEEFECLHRQLINAGTQKKLAWTSYMYNFKLILAIFH